MNKRQNNSSGLAVWQGVISKLGCTILVSFLTACGDGSGVAAEAISAPASAPTGMSVSYSIKSFGLNWTAAAKATHYELLEDPDGAAGPEAEASVSSNITMTSHQLTVPLFLRLNASYRVRACNASGCGPATAAMTIDVNQAIGYFKPNYADADDLFGRSIAVSANGTTLAVGMPGDDSNARGVNGDEANNDINNTFDSGAVLIFVRGNAGWTKQAYIKPSNTSDDSRFGWTVALSAEGDTLAVGALGENNNTAGINSTTEDYSAPASGAAYVFKRSGNTWSQQAYIKANDAAPFDQFGASVAISADGNTLAVGAEEEGSNATGINGNQLDFSSSDSGAVYVFTRIGAAWSQQAYIKASNTGGGDAFGSRITLSGDGNILAVAARGEDSNATGINGDQQDNSSSGSGAVYVFTRNGATWSQQAYIKASNTESGDGFGRSLTLSTDGNSLAVSASTEDSAATGINGDQMSNSALSSGAVYVFVRNGAVWSQQAYIKASNSVAGLQLGSSVAFSGDGNVLAIGAFSEASNALGIGGDQSNTASIGSGATYVFVRSGASWLQRSYIKASNTEASDGFGSALAISTDGKTLAVAATGEDSSAIGIGGNQSDNSVSRAGAVYLY